MTAFCAHPGCMAALGATNVSGVCKAHMHGDACRCATCASARARGTKRRNPAYRIKTRAELQAEGLLPGLTMTPQWKGSR